MTNESHFFSDRLTPQQAAEILGVKPGTLNVWRCTKRYSLPYAKIGSRVYYKVSDIKKFIESRTVRCVDE